MILTIIEENELFILALHKYIESEWIASIINNQ